MDSEVIPPSQDIEVIQPIDRSTVHRICSGQVVLSLAIAVKELVENAIDAGATIIDIELKEYGSESVQVSDNATGVKEENFQALTLKHYTSKIKQFDDLTSLSTLGFRGEALSSLCALSELTVFTKHGSAGNATKIKYDRNGKIVSQTLGAREIGTTVTLENLFSSLPVRRKEFLKNLKREFNKMCQLLYAYCLVSKGIKFSCTNTTSKGSKNTVVCTDGLQTVKDNIINVFGSKQISTLIEVEMIKPEEPILVEYNITLVEGESLPFSFDFFISGVTHGNGRSTTDRQFFYINSRPCEPTKVTKLVNEIYRQYNSSQYPFIYLNILSRSCLVDVNVTPDKRQIFLEKEKILLATLKSSLVEAFKNFPSTFKVQNLDLSQTTMSHFVEKKKGMKRSLTDSGIKKGSILEKFKKRSKTENNKESLIGPQGSFSENKNAMLDSFVKIATELCENEAKILTADKKEDEDVMEEIKIVCGQERDKKLGDGDTKEDKDLIEQIKIVCGQDRSDKIENVVSVESDETRKKKLLQHLEKPELICKKLEDTVFDADVEVALDTSVRDRSSLKKVTLTVTLDDVRNSLKKKKERAEEGDVKVRFRSKINPESNKSAEEELRKQILKADFSKMQIIGQFNLGFIIARLENDLFIIDQHATDEKYNFEQLQANTVMEKQVLVNPKPLQLTAGNETLLIENVDIFRKNGFTFKIDESAPCTKKVFLTSVPLSKSVIFGKDDIDEMLFMLQDSNHTMCRPSRIRAMFASRACRQSVMIGKSLSKTDMRKLVDHMGEIKQPWNCPHGRPTMRHLINLDLIHTEET